MMVQTPAGKMAPLALQIAYQGRAFNIPEPYNRVVIKSAGACDSTSDYVDAVKIKIYDHQWISFEISRVDKGWRISTNDPLMAAHLQKAGSSEVQTIQCAGTLAKLGGGSDAAAVMEAGAYTLFFFTIWPDPERIDFLVPYGESSTLSPETPVTMESSRAMKRRIQEEKESEARRREEEEREQARGGVARSEVIAAAAIQEGPDEVDEHNLNMLKQGFLEALNSWAKHHVVAISFERIGSDISVAIDKTTGKIIGFPENIRPVGFGDNALRPCPRINVESSLVEGKTVIELVSIDERGADKFESPEAREAFLRLPSVFEKAKKEF